MSDSLIERMARAMCSTYGDNFDEQPESGEGLHPYNPGLPSRSDWRRIARAALAAAREPSDAMGEAADQWASMGTALHVWRAMIDAALREEG